MEATPTLQPVRLPSRQDRREVLRKVAGTLPSLPFETWNFGDSVGFEAMLAASDTLGDRSLESFAHGWMRAWATRAQPYRLLDCTAPGHAMVEVARRRQDGALVAACIGLARYLMSRPLLHGVYEVWEHSCLIPPYGGEALPPDEAQLLAEPPEGAFLDCLHFDPPFLTELGRLTEDQSLVDTGVAQALHYIALLQQGSGLFDHFALRGVPNRTYGPGWGRGQGWALLGLLDDIRSLPGDDVDRPPLVESARALIEAMLRTQRPDGHWNAVVTDPDSGVESSTAAFMAAAFVRAARLGVVDDTVLPAARAGLAAALRRTDDQGRLADVSAAVMASTRPSHYAHVPRGFLVPWGQGPLVMALAEFDDED
jgi:unsaturated rhamnogalacturonyl hydrolase